jgi:hypothetical protein
MDEPTACSGIDWDHPYTEPSRSMLDACFLAAEKAAETMCDAYGGSRESYGTNTAYCDFGQ